MKTIQVKEVEYMVKQLPQSEQLRLAYDLYSKFSAISKPNQATLNLLAKWDAEDQFNDLEEAEKDNQEVNKFLHNLNKNRLEMEGSNARHLYS